jgi:hypothetical protein
MIFPNFSHKSNKICLMRPVHGGRLFIFPKLFTSPLYRFPMSIYLSAGTEGNLAVVRGGPSLSKA